jgi:YbgC/YbaW family acyl-CoA thioester hydrolase
MFTYKKKILFGDCDMAGILFFANLFKYMHEAYEFFISEFEDYNVHFNNKKVGYPVINTEAEYYSPLFLGKDAEINVSVNQVRESSYELIYEFIIENELKAKGRTVHVCVNISDGKKQPLNNNLSENLRKHLIEK